MKIQEAATKIYKERSHSNALSSQWQLFYNPLSFFIVHLAAFQVKKFIHLGIFSEPSPEDLDRGSKNAVLLVEKSPQLVGSPKGSRARLLVWSVCAKVVAF